MHLVGCAVHHVQIGPISSQSEHDYQGMNLKMDQRFPK